MLKSLIVVNTGRCHNFGYFVIMNRISYTDLYCLELVA